MQGWAASYSAPLGPYKKVPPVSLAAGHQIGVGYLILGVSRGKQSREVHMNPVSRAARTLIISQPLSNFLCKPALTVEIGCNPQP